MPFGICFFLALLLLMALLPGQVQAQGPDGAHVIVQFGDAEIVGRRIGFAAPISGLKALELTGLKVVTYDFGTGIAVCSIQGVGCPKSNCFCDPDNFWNYSYCDGSAWQGYLVGTDSSAIADGAIEGWRWGPWDGSMRSAPPVVAAVKALEYLRPLQSAGDGGYGTGGATTEALLAVAADGYRAREWRRQALSPSLSSYFVQYGATLANSGAGSSGKLAVALAGGDGCWPQAALEPESYYHPATGAYSSTHPFDSGIGVHAWGVLGTAALSQPVPTQAVQFLKTAQRPGGGWEWDVGWGEDTNSTALALQALAAAGQPVGSNVVVKGLDYLDAAQNDDGGFPYSPTSPWGTDSDTNSTAYVVQALLAVGQSPSGPRWSTHTNGITPTNPISYLLSMQLANGSFEWQAGAGSNESATRQAIPALLARPFPLQAANLAPCLSRYLPLVRKGSR